MDPFESSKSIVSHSNHCVCDVYVSTNEPNNDATINMSTTQIVAVDAARVEDGTSSSEGENIRRLAWEENIRIPLNT